MTLDRGATVLLYTDGLIERRDADLDGGMVRLRDALIELADRPLDELLDELLERLRARPPGGRRRPGRRPAAPPGPAPTGGGGAEPRAADRPDRSGVLTLRNDRGGSSPSGP